jgi:hypothetical protein
MYSRCGETKIWHWAHQPGCEKCAGGEESEWHLAWKAEAIDSTQEVRVGDRPGYAKYRVADVLAPGKYTVELQASKMLKGPLREREADWATQGGIVWIFKAIKETGARRVEWHTPLEFLSDPRRVQQITWKDMPDRVKHARAPAFLDLGNDRLLFVGGWYPGSQPRTGWGWPVTRQWVIHNVLKGDKVPEPFGEDPEVIRRRQEEERRALRQARREAELRHLREERERAERAAAIETQMAQVWQVLEGSLDRLSISRQLGHAADAADQVLASLFRWRPWISTSGVPEWGAFLKSPWPARRPKLRSMR